MIKSFTKTTATVLVALLATVVHAQDVFFTDYPTQVLSGQFYPVSWESAGAPVTVNLLRAGVLEETLFTTTDAAVTSFTWEVDDDDDGGVDYALQLVPTGGVPLTSGTIWIIGDDDGLLVNGQVIFASVSNGPQPSGYRPTASSVPGASDSTTSPAASQIQTTQTVAFTTAGSSYTFVATIDPTNAPTASGAAETLTFISNGLSFTTTINLNLATDSAAPDQSGTPAGSSGAENGGGIGAGAIAGIVVGVVVLVLVVLGFWWFRRRRQRQRRDQSDSNGSSVRTFINGGRRALSNRKSVASTEKNTIDEERTAERTSLVSPLSPGHHELETPIQKQTEAKATPSAEIDGVNRHEMTAEPPRYELAAENVPVEIGSPAREPNTSSSVSRAGTVSHSGITSNGSVSAVSNV